MDSSPAPFSPTENNLRRRSHAEPLSNELSMRSPQFQHLQKVHLLLLDASWLRLEELRVVLEHLAAGDQMR